MGTGDGTVVGTTKVIDHGPATEKWDLVMLGAYAKGSDKELDEAIAKMPNIEQYLRQSPMDRASYEESIAALARVVR